MPRFLYVNHAVQLGQPVDSVEFELDGYWFRPDGPGVTHRLVRHREWQQGDVRRARMRVGASILEVEASDMLAREAFRTRRSLDGRPTFREIP